MRGGNPVAFRAGAVRCAAPFFVGCPSGRRREAARISGQPRLLRRSRGKAGQRPGTPKRSRPAAGGFGNRDGAFLKKKTGFLRARPRSVTASRPSTVSRGCPAKSALSRGPSPKRSPFGARVRPPRRTTPGTRRRRQGAWTTPCRRRDRNRWLASKPLRRGFEARNIRVLRRFPCGVDRLPGFRLRILSFPSDRELSVGPRKTRPARRRQKRIARLIPPSNSPLSMPRAAYPAEARSA